MASLELATRFPSLGTGFPSPATGDALHTKGRIRDPSERSTLRALLSQKNDDALHHDHEKLLQAFATFVLDFTGEEEITYQFHIHDASRRPAACPSVGIVHATIQDVSLSSSAIDAGSQRPGTCAIDIQQPTNQDTDFGLIIDLGNNDNFTVSDRLRAKPFVVRLDASSISLDFCRAVLPLALEGSVFNAVANALAAAVNFKLVGPRPQLSTLNHPPQVDPPSWDGAPGSWGDGMHELLYSAFSRRANEHPEHVALEFLEDMDSSSSTYTYRELDTLSSALAREILDVFGTDNSEEQRIVPVFLSTSAELYVSWLAVLKSGCAFCPLPVEAPAEFLSGILEETAATVVLGRGSGAGAIGSHFPPTHLRWIDVQAFTGRYSITQAPTHFRLPSPRQHDVAYVMYTSGSTGKPKGVAITHHSAVCTIASHIITVPHVLERKGTLRWFQFAAPTFDPSVMEIFVTLSTGATLCSCDRLLALTNPEAAITKLQATIMMATPSMAALLRPDHVPSLRYLWTMGETLGRAVIERFASDSTSRPGGDKRALVNAYGPTEGSINCTIHANVSQKQRGSVIGHPLPTCSMLVLDPNSRSPAPVPLGFPGELAIGGPQVSVGYLHPTEQTSAAFVEDEEYGRIYRTGDKSRIVQDQDGSLVIDFLGRITTDQVKLSGRRVDLGDIEAVMSNPLIHEAAAVVSSTPILSGESSGSEKVVVFLVPHQPYESEAIVNLCTKDAGRLLQPFMRPSTYYILDSMPRSTSGKLDRKALKALLTSTSLTPLFPSTLEIDQLEDSGDNDTLLETVRDALAEATNVSPVSISRSTVLLALGFDSLRGVKFLQKCRELGLRELSITDVLSARTLKGLLSRFQQEGADDTSTASLAEFSSIAQGFASSHLETCAQALSIPKADIELILPTTSTQAGMLASFLRSLDHRDTESPSSKSYIHQSIYTIGPGNDPDAVRQAWTNVLRRHEMARTAFVQVDDSLTPFAHCVVSSSSAIAEVEWNVHTCSSDTTFNDAIERAMGTAFRSIVLELPPLCLSIVYSPNRTAIILGMFHGIFDGGSLQLLLEDIGREYRNLPQLPRTGISTAVSRHFSSDRSAAAQFWLESLKGNTSSPFPNLRTTITKSERRVCKTAYVNSDLTLDAIRSKAATLQCSPLAVLHAAWSLILYSYTGYPNDVTFGSVISDRFSNDLARCSALTFTTVPVRVSVGEEQSKSNLEITRGLTNLNATSLNYLHTPLSSILTKDGRLPYDTLLAFQEFPQGSGGDQAIYSEVDFPVMVNDFAVMVEVWPTRYGTLELKATYDYELLDDSGAQTMLEQLNKTISNVLSSPEALFTNGQSAFPRTMLSEAEDQGTIPSSAERMLLHRPFETHAVENPDRLALVFRSSKTEGSIETLMTYRELNQRAEQVAAYLGGLFITTSDEDRVIPICMAKCPDLYVAMLGILKAGAAWCPIDPSFPPIRQRHLIERTGSRIVLVSSSTSCTSRDALPSAVEMIDFANEPWAYTIATDTPLPPRTEPAETDLAYLIFTSGTTGAPKGVPVSHLAASSAMRALEQTIPGTTSGEPIRCMQFSQYTFDVSVQDLFYTWRVGGTVISATQELMIGTFADLANTTEATHAHLTPAFGASLRRKDLKTLQVITMIGEKLPQTVADDWGDAMRAYNTYGPAEAAVVSTLRQFGGVENLVRSSNIGYPLSTIHAYVMHNGQPVMRNGVGELVLAGVQLARGYWRDPDITSKKFTWNEFAGSTIYHTGDIVRQLADGSFDFVGRNDDLVKINGMRVELSEIAATCRDCHKLVDQTEVMYAPLSGTTENSVICFIGASNLGESSDKAGLIVQGGKGEEMTLRARKWAQSRLPKHMVPDLFVVLNAIPRTPSAKVDRKALLELLDTIDTSSAKHDNEDNQGEAVDPGWLAQYSAFLPILRSISKLPRKEIGPATGLSDLGIDSIGAINLSSRLKKEGLAVSVIDVLRCTTVGEIADLISNNGGKEDSLGEWEHQISLFDASWRLPVCEALGTSDFKLVPATIMQEGVLTESMREPLSYWGNYFCTLSDSVDHEQLKRAWSGVLSNTEALRASFLPTATLPESSADGPRATPIFLQIIRTTATLPWEVKETKDQDRAALAWQVFEDAAREHHSRGFSAVPWKVTILKARNESTMLITMHHSIYDADSVGYLLQDVAKSYSDLTYKSQRCQLSEAVARTNLVNIREEPLAFWTKVLSPFAEADEARAGFTSRTGSAHRTQEMRLGSNLSRLRLAARDLGVSSINALFRVAWGSMLAELSESSRFLFGEIRSDRILDGRLADAIAPLVSTIPVPFIAEGSPRHLIMAQDRLLHESPQNSHIRPGTVRELIRKPLSEPLYPAVLVFHPEQQEKCEQGTKLWGTVEEAFEIAVEHPLALNVIEKEDDSVLLSLSVDARLMNAPAQQCFLQGIDALIESMLYQPDTLSVLHLTESFPWQLQSVSSRNPDSNCPAEWQPTYWIERWAKEHPDWVAAEIAEDAELKSIKSTSWTYRELNDEANRIAAWIKSQCVDSSAIGVCLDRDLMSLAVILGIMKSGNTYVPIEEGLPLERKAFLFEDSDAALLFTTPELFKQGSKQTNTRIVDVTDPSILSAMKTMSTKNPEDQGDLFDTIYILYTSGSTGKPKGVQVNRRNLSSFMEAQSTLICREASATQDLGGKGKYLCLASRAFDVHIGEMFLAWRHGLSVVTGSRLLLLDNLALCLKALKITHASFVPSLLDQTGLTPSDTPDLVYLGVGGEKMTPRTQDIWSSSQRVNLVNAYGPTEVTIGCCSGRVYPNSDPRNIGRPLGDSVAHVFLPGTEIHVKRGMPGELAFTGSLVATGYHNRPDAQGFVINNSGERMYRTGDIVCMAPDESIIFMGRKDDQVKVRGQRLELGEISEAVRTASQDPIDVATLLLQHPHISRPQLVSFVATTGTRKKTELKFMSDLYETLDTKLRNACELVLPAYMVPDLLIPISHIPLTQTSAKADNKMLKALFQEIPSSLLFRDEVLEEPEVSRELTPAEKEIAQVLQHEAAQLSGKDLKPSTSIFQLGIDSLRAINVSVKLRRAGFECSVANILQNPTIEQLAGFKNSATASTELNGTSRDLLAAHSDMLDLESRVRMEVAAKGVIADSDVIAVRPCLPLQEALVAHSIANNTDDGNNYINHIVFKIYPDVRIEALVRSWDAVISSNEILRTTFCCLKRDIVQVVLSATASRRPWTRLEIAPHMLRDSLRSLRPTFDKDILDSLETDPPLRFTIASSGKHNRLLMLSIHHSLYDMESLGMLMKDVQDVYEQNATSRPATEPLYAHLVLAKRHYELAKKHWTTVFQNWVYTPLEVLHAGAPTRETARVFRTSLKELETSCSSLGFTLAALIQGLFGYALAKAKSQDDVVFGTVLSGRSVAVEGIEDMMVPCITTVPHRVDLRASGGSLSNLTREMQKQSFDSLDHQHTPLRDIQAWVGASGPLFDTIFSFVRTSTGTSEGREGEILALVEDEMSLEYALAVECEANSANNEIALRGRSTINSDSASDLDLLLEQIETLANAVVRGEEVPITQFEPLASSQEPSKRQIYDESAWTSLEEQIKHAIVAFSEVSSTEVAKNTSFIRLGIDSISSIRFAKELRQLGLVVSSADVIRNPSIGALAQCIQRRLDESSNASKGSNGGESAASGADLSSDAKPWSAEDRIVTTFPLSPLQTGMITSTLTFDAKLYSHHHAFVLSDTINLVRLKVAWKLLLTRHEILRTSFHPSQKSSSNWVGAVHQEPVLQWAVRDVDSVDRGLQHLVQETRHNGHASFAVPPVKATILMDPRQTLLVVSIHHVTYDGVSVGFIFSDLLDLYNGTSPPERSPFSIAAAAIWKSSQQSTAFWGRQIEGYKSFNLVGEPEGPEEPSMNSYTLRITDDVSAMIESCLKSDATLQTAALAAFGKTLCYLRGARDIVFGQVVAGRNIAIDGADMVSGPMFNTVPFRLRLPDPAESNAELLRRTQDLANESLSFEHVSLAEVQKRWRGRSKSSMSLFDSIFVFQRNPAVNTGESQPLWRPYEAENDGSELAPSEYNMNFELHQQDDDTLVVQAFSKLPKRKLEDFVQLFKATLENLSQHQDSLVTAFPEQLSQFPVEPQAANNLSNAKDHAALDTEAIAKFFVPVQGILAEVANVSKGRIKPTTSVFSIGLDSILAIRVSSECRKAGVPLGAADVIKAVTVGKICEIAFAKFNKAKDKKLTNDAPRVSIAPDIRQAALSRLGLRSDAVEDVFPVLPGQEYHIVSWLKSGRTLYEPSWVFRSQKALNTNRLLQAWVRLRRRHPVLRSCFVSVGEEQALQVILRPTSVAEQDSTTTVERVGNGDMSLETRTRAAIKHIASHPSTLSTPPVRLLHIQGGDEGDAVAITVHHAAYDAWTMVRLIPELMSLYSGETLSSTNPSFGQFVEQVIRHRGGEEEQGYWREALAGSQRTIVQPRIASVESHNELSCKQTFVIVRGSQTNLKTLEQVSRAARTTPQSILVLAFSRLLAHETGSRHPIFGYFQTGRSASFDNIESLSGPCLNMLPFAIPGDLAQGKDGSGELRGSLAAIRDSMAVRMAHEQSYLRDVLRWTGLPGGEVPFNTYLNILWNDELFISPKTGENESLLQPMPIGVPTDYSSQEAIPGETSVDGLDTSIIRNHNVFVDVGPNRETGKLDFGSRCDAALMEREALEELVTRFDQEVDAIVAALSLN